MYRSFGTYTAVPCIEYSYLFWIYPSIHFIRCVSVCACVCGECVFVYFSFVVRISRFPHAPRMKTLQNMLKHDFPCLNVSQSTFNLRFVCSNEEWLIWYFRGKPNWWSNEPNYVFYVQKLIHFRRRIFSFVLTLFAWLYRSFWFFHSERSFSSFSRDNTVKYS